MPLNEDLMKNFQEALNKEIENIDKTMIPLLRIYLNNVQEIRMAFGREVQSIIQSSRNLHEITANQDELFKFAKVLGELRQILTPEFLELLKKLTKE